jgi:glycosyltransferase involved in cell wall biosynthesis
MNITLVSYLDPFVYHGGGEQALRAAIEHGRRRGHHITVLARRTGKFSRLVAPALAPPRHTNLFLLADLFNCPEDNVPFEDRFLRGIVEHEPFLHWDNSWVDVCARPALPCNGDRAQCPDACGRERARWLYGRALACIFLSPLHAWVVEGLLGPDVVRRRIIARPLIDTTIFYNQHRLRDIDFLCVGTVARYKGYENVKRLLAGEKILFIGANATGETLIGVHIPRIAHHDLPRYYNRAKTFVHLPEWIEPQGRTVVEAALCGCALLTNENVGAMSFPFPLTAADEIHAAPDLLWNEIEEVAAAAGLCEAGPPVRAPRAASSLVVPR